MSTEPSQLPTIVTDRYTIERQLGAGGMATVYLARDIRHDREVALKVLRPELGAVLGADRFLAEIKITARLDHPHILTLIDSGVADGLLYYVLPYVRGESLRDLLHRETQIDIDQALAYTRQVASALDYAHRHGVIHRDIKPENILIQEGEAILADFGIALAVKEAGGSRLTETGLSLGTPQYMSPEQATGDRTLDARSDVYSLAAVLYEMLTGEPPINGSTVQAMIAKLLTEQPTRIRTIRNTVPERVDAAVAKALSKLPADRFTSAGEFVRALETGKGTAAFSTAPASSKWRVPALVGGGVLVAAAVAAFAMSTRGGAPAASPISLRDRTQLTFTGNVVSPAISSDGKQIAYFSKTCPTERCTYAIEVQDVGGTSSRRVLDGLSAAYYVELSPDRRNLLFNGTLNGRYGMFIVSANGGNPRLVTAGAAGFYAGGDSLLAGPNAADDDSAFTVKVTSLSGDVGRTLKVRGGTALIGLVAVPGSDRFIAQLLDGPRAIWQLLDREGNVTDRVMNSCTCGGAASTDALWMARAGPTNAEAIVRVAIDGTTGKYAAKQDTVYSGRFSGLSVTADGSALAVDDGTFDFSVVAVSLADAFTKKFPAQPLMSASTAVNAFVSPDGSRLLKRTSLPDSRGSSVTRLSVAPFEGGAETPIELDGRLLRASWVDSVTIALGVQTSKGLKLSEMDVRTRAVRNTMELPDSVVVAAQPVAGGWAWVPPGGSRIVISQNGKQREIPKPAWFYGFNDLSVSPDGTQLLYGGWNLATSDTLGYETMPLAGGRPTRVLTKFAETGGSMWLADGSVLIAIWDTPESVALHKIGRDGKVEALGAIPRLARSISVSQDMKRMTILTRDYKGDAWMYRVAKHE